MVTFEVFLNKKKLCTAGIGETGVLTAIVDWTGAAVGAKTKRSPQSAQAVKLSVGGLVGKKSEHLHWSDRRLKVGDEVRIRVSEAQRASRPVSRT
jgi:hypothetical protein